VTSLFNFFYFIFVAKRNGRPLAACFFVAARNLFYCESFSYRQSKSWSGATKNTRYFYQRNNNIKSHKKKLNGILSNN